MLPELTRRTKQMQTLALIGHASMYAVAALGTVLATLGEGRWVAATVAYSTTVSRLMAAYRIDELRVAFVQAAATLESERAHWLALGPEEKALQKSIDKIT